MKINQSVDAGPVSSAIVFDSYPKGAVVKFTMTNGDDVIIRTGRDELVDLEQAINEWLNQSVASEDE